MRLVADQHHALPVSGAAPERAQDRQRILRGLERAGDLYSIEVERGGEELGGLHRAHQRARHQQIDRLGQAGEGAGDAAQAAASLVGERALVVAAGKSGRVCSDAMADDKEADHRDP